MDEMIGVTCEHGKRIEIAIAGDAPLPIAARAIWSLLRAVCPACEAEFVSYNAAAAAWKN